MKARGEASRLLSLLLAGALVDDELAEAELLADAKGRIVSKIIFMAN